MLVGGVGGSAGGFDLVAAERSLASQAMTLSVITNTSGRVRLSCSWVAPMSLHRLASVDHHGVADHEGGRVRAQPEDGRGDLFGLAHPPDRLSAITFARPSGVPPVKRPIIGVSM